MFKKYIFPYLKKYFFYDVDKKEKSNIRRRIMEDDHKALKVLIILVLILQLFMYVRSIINYGFDWSKMESYQIHYRLLYVALGFSCIISYVVLEALYRKKADFAYFCAINTMLVVTALWGVGITLLESYNTVNLTTFAYVMIVLPAFLIIEPWIACIDLISVTVFLIIGLSTGNHPEILVSSNMINIISILVISCLIGGFTFYRIIKKLNLEMKIQDLNSQLELKVDIDDLTKLYNRSYLTQHINDPLSIGDRVDGVMMLDIDHFKDVNDIYGHHAGDIFLAKTGEIIKTFLNDNGYAVRYGGEEFLIYYRNTTKEELLNKADELRKIFESTNVKIDRNTSVLRTVSIGTATATLSLSYSGLISLADKALYEAKKTRNIVK